MIFYCVCNLVFSDDQRFFLLEDFTLKMLSKEISGRYVYLSPDVLELYEACMLKSQKKQFVKKVPLKFNLCDKIADDLSNSSWFNPKKRKYYEEFLMLLNDQFYEYFAFCLNFKHFSSFLLKSEMVKLANIAVLRHFNSLNFSVESGKNFGFDYLLYEKMEGDQKEKHLHSPYAVDIIKNEFGTPYTAVLGKLRIAKNYGKALILLKVTQKDKEGLDEFKNLELEYIMQRFQIESLILK